MIYANKMVPKTPGVELSREQRLNKKVMVSFVYRSKRNL